MNVFVRWPKTFALGSSSSTKGLTGFMYQMEREKHEQADRYRQRQTDTDRDRERDLRFTWRAWALEKLSSWWREAMAAWRRTSSSTSPLKSVSLGCRSVTSGCISAASKASETWRRLNRSIFESAILDNTSSQFCWRERDDEWLNSFATFFHFSILYSVQLFIEIKKREASGSYDK